MITPSKTIPFKDSIAFKMIYILDERFDEIFLVDLYRKTKGCFSGSDEFIYALDALYVLGKIDMNLKAGKVIKC